MNEKDIELQANIKAAKTLIIELRLAIDLLEKRKAKAERWLALYSQYGLNIGAPSRVEKKQPLDKDPYSPEFETAWKLYPERNGYKAEKRGAWNKFKKLNALDQRAVIKAIENYRKSPDVSRGVVRDMVRFLKPDFWVLWINPSQKMLLNSKENRHGKIEKDTSVVDEAIREVTGKSSASN